MSITRVRVLSAALFVLTFMSGASAGMLLLQSNGTGETRLHQLLREKLTTLETIVTQKEKLHSLRVIGLKDLCDAHLAMLRAKLDLCATDEAKIAVLEEMLAKAKHRENAMKELPMEAIQGVPEEAMVLRLEEAKVDRLEIEIELERFKSKP